MDKQISEQQTMPVVPSANAAPPPGTGGSIFINDWYWIVGGDANNVWSSARAMSVPDTDQEYQAWLGYGRTPTSIASQADLEAMFAVQYPAGSLRSYNPDARWRRRNSGVIVTSLSPVAFMSDDSSVNDINSSYNYGQVNAGATFHWKMSNGSFVTLNVTQITTLHNDVLNYVQSCFTMESTNLTGIGNGSITTLAQIDAAFAGISNVFP